MRRRIVLAHVAVVGMVLLLLEVPLAITFARREREALLADVERDAVSLATLAEEVIEDPGGHDVETLARRFRTDSAGDVVVIESAGVTVSSQGDDGPLATPLRRALDRAGQGERSTGHDAGSAFAAEPVGTQPEVRGAVLVAHDDGATEGRIHQLWLALGTIAVVALVATGLVGDWVARWAVRPLRRLDQRAAALGRGDLTARADPGSGPPEVVELTRTFNDMASRLNELVGSQQRFVADASHQLRSPLTALRLRLDAIDLSDRAAADADIEAAINETMRLSHLIDGLLALMRAEGAQAERRPVDVLAVVEQRRDAWWALADERRVELRTQLPEHPVELAMADGHLEQILDNLIDNAIEVTPAGRSVTLAVTTAPAAVEVHVIDEGPGMGPDDLARAFERFWQAAPGRRTGSGLGLPVVARLARANGGEARLTASARGGIDAVVRFPARRS